MSDEYFVVIFQLAFTCAVYPCLILAYMGQAAFLSRNNAYIERSFYMSIPSNSLSISIYLLCEFNLKNGQWVSIIWYLLRQNIYVEFADAFLLIMTCSYVWFLHMHFYSSIYSWIVCIYGFLCIACRRLLIHFYLICVCMNIVSEMLSIHLYMHNFGIKIMFLSTWYTLDCS